MGPGGGPRHSDFLDPRLIAGRRSCDISSVAAAIHLDSPSPKTRGVPSPCFRCAHTTVAALSKPLQRRPCSVVARDLDLLCRASRQRTPLVNSRRDPRTTSLAFQAKEHEHHLPGNWVDPMQRTCQTDGARTPAIFSRSHPIPIRIPSRLSPISQQPPQCQGGGARGTRGGWCSTPVVPHQPSGRGTPLRCHNPRASEWQGLESVSPENIAKLRNEKARGARGVAGSTHGLGHRHRELALAGMYWHGSGIL